MRAADADVVIVGAGPAGATAAIALRAAGAGRVVLLDAARFPRPKACGGAIARRGVEALAKLGVPLAVPHVPLYAAEIRGGGLRLRLAARTRRPLGVVVRREELDAALVHAARGRGAEVREGVRVVGIGPFEAGARTVRTNAGELVARRVIGADGATSMVGKTVRAERGGPAPAVAAATEAFTERGDDDPPPGRMRYDFSFGGTTNGGSTLGYGWDFPCRLAGGGAGFNRGVYSTRPRDLPRAVPRQLDAFLDAREAAIEGTPLSWPERLYDERRPISAPGVFLAGEAIGVNPVTGEGIAPAIESAVFAARAVSASLADASGPGAWEPYTLAFRRSILGRRLSFGARLARLLYGPHGRFFRDLGLHDHRFQQLLLEDFSGDLDIPLWKRWLAVRLAWDVAAQLVRELR